MPEQPLSWARERPIECRQPPEEARFNTSFSAVPTSNTRCQLTPPRPRPAAEPYQTSRRPQSNYYQASRRASEHYSRTPHDATPINSRLATWFSNVFYSNVVPKSLHCRPLVDTPYGRKLARDFSRGSLKARIQENKQQIIQARRKVYASEAYLRIKLRAADFSEVLEARARAETLEREKCTHAHDKKLSGLLPSLPQRHTEATSIQNLSRKQLSWDHAKNKRNGRPVVIPPSLLV
ncbi:hypothetical protein HPB50_025023 [Hyalomma asiaticum]|uniref:Uncharacterized protein n=1 Tax=Hyalomma asiaticum TaxID=266040 RepID=A0ACB7TC97_HYAAI|nr:hypothetical protein HPB50_025023 [Hyalomma asiaticum]